MTFIPDKLNENFTKKPHNSTHEGLRVKTILPNGTAGPFETLVNTPEKSILHLQFPYGIQNDLVAASGVLGGYVTGSNNFSVLGTGTSTSGTAVLESSGAVRYIAGTGVRVKFTAVFSDPKENSTQVIGIGDDTDGFFVGYSGSQFGFLRKNTGTEYWTFQDSWNADKLNGSGSSGMIIAPQSGNVYMIDYQWLGFGAISLFTEDDKSGAFNLAHRIHYTNNNVETSISNPTLPLRSYVENYGNDTDMVLKSPSIGAFIIGENLNDGIRRAAKYTGSIGPTETPLMSLKNVNEFRGSKNRARAKFNYMSLSNRARQIGSVNLYINPSLTGANFQSVDVNESIIQKDESSTSFSGGRFIMSFAFADSESLQEKLDDFEIFINPGDILLFTAELNSSIGDITVVPSWLERF